jgi:hypothetical protein
MFRELKNSLWRWSDANPSLWLSLITTAFLVGLFLSYGARSTGTYFGDDIAHYLIARYSWKHPDLFLDTWGRPTFTLLYAPAAALGFAAVKIFSALLAGATCLAGAYLARAYGVRWSWQAALFIGLQPEFLRQSFSSLTELSFAFVLVLALIAHKKQKWALMAAAAGWLPLARYESLPIVLMFAIILVQKKKVPCLLLVAGPLFVQNCFWALKEAHLAYLIFPFDKLLGWRPNIAKYDYATRGVLYYIGLLPAAYGVIGLGLAGWGAIRAKLGTLQLSILLAVGTLSLTCWLLPSAGVPGYARHLAGVAPAVGVLSAIGLAKISRYMTDGMKQPFALGLGAVLIAGLILSTVGSVRPFSLSREDRVVLRAANWFMNSSYRDRLALGSHPYFLLGANLDRFDPDVFLQLTPQNLSRSPSGSIIIWDSHYSPRLRSNVPSDTLQDSGRFRRLRSWENRAFRIIIYEKLDPHVGRTGTEDRKISASGCRCS